MIYTIINCCLQVLRKPDKQIAVAYTKDFPPGQMREVDAGKNNKVLLVRVRNAHVD